jgi:hypothetical protein
MSTLIVKCHQPRPIAPQATQGYEGSAPCADYAYPRNPATIATTRAKKDVDTGFGIEILDPDSCRGRLDI